MKSLFTALVALLTLAGCATKPAGQAASDGQTVIGLSLIDPSPERLKRYHLSETYPGPIVVGGDAKSYFARGDQPNIGCSIWIIESPAYGILPQESMKKAYPSKQPHTIKEMASAILECAASPSEVEAMQSELRELIMKRLGPGAPTADKMKARLETAKGVSAPIRKSCRLVYNYPDGRGTMTTVFALDERDLNELQRIAGR
jgi:hypothetical protein